MRYILVLPFALALTIAASAQPPAPPQSPSERALAQRLMAEINVGLQLSAQLIAAQDRIATLEKELADEKAKTVPPVAPTK